VLAALLELAPGGVEQVDGEGFVEYGVYGAPGELPSFPDGEAEAGVEEAAEDGAKVLFYRGTSLAYQAPSVGRTSRPAST
jgi:hypothetical protein